MALKPGDDGAAAMSEQEPPAVRVARGNATGEEVAAVLTVLMARLAARERRERAARAAAATARRTPSAWCDRSSLLRTPVIPGPGGWRASAFPGG
jgi:hypothetical protein